MSLHPALVTLAETTPAVGGINPYIVGGTIFTLLVVTMLGLLAFGAGRDHS